MAFFSELLKELSPNQILLQDTALESYATDASYAVGAKPSAVVFVDKPEQVQYVLMVANRHRIPVTVRGAGTGKSGGAVPEEGGVVLSLNRLEKRIEVDEKNRVVTVSAHVVIQELQAAVLKHRLFYPVDPASLDRCTVGGTIAENAGGPRALKYGVTGNYILGLEGVFGTGAPFKLGGKLHKDVAGYDLKRLLIGSEGTLAVITAATLKCIVLPQNEWLMWLAFDTVQDACHFLQACREARVQPSLAEMMQGACLRAVEKTIGSRIPFSEREAHVLLGIDGGLKQLEESLCSITAVADRWNEQIQVAKTELEKQLFLSWRRGISESLSAQCMQKISEDITVPIAQIPAIMSYLKQLNETEPYEILGYGHLGDGNVHVNVLNRSEPLEKWTQDIPVLKDKLMEQTLKLGGTITGEHGVGLTKKRYLQAMFSSETIGIMKAVKRVFDPNNILNPTKIF